MNLHFKAPVDPSPDGVWQIKENLGSFLLYSQVACSCAHALSKQAFSN